MKTIQVNGRDYEIEGMPAAAKQQLAALKFVDAEMDRLGAHIAALKTARLVYVSALSQALQPPTDPLVEHLKGDTIKLG